MSEPEFDREMAEALENAEAAEVVCIILPVINQCLVYDSRSGQNDPPRITVSAPLGSGERRLRHVNKARPHLERARELAILPWSGSINAFEGSKIWGMLEDRAKSSGFDSLEKQASEALDELRQWERRSMVSMIRGQGPFHTIWSRSDN
jgi:hypothetical protein